MPDPASRLAVQLITLALQSIGDPHARRHAQQAVDHAHAEHTRHTTHVDPASYHPDIGATTTNQEYGW